MPQDYQKLFSYLPPATPSDKLLPLILKRLHRRQWLAARRRLLIWLLGLIGSALAGAPILILAKTGLTDSGFIQFFSLLFSDFGWVLGNWQSYLWTLLESLPILNTIGALAVILIFLESLRRLAQNLKALPLNHLHRRSAIFI